MNNFDYIIFSDASCRPKSERCVGGYVILDVNINQATPINLTHFKALGNIQAELISLLYAFKYFCECNQYNQQGKLQVITDCTNIVTLPDRREKLEHSNFTNKQGQRLKNADLYMDFYRFCDTLSVQFKWVKGHTSKGKRTHPDQIIFSQLDREVRKTLRGLS